jgi:hypothetical protein
MGDTRPSLTVARIVVFATALIAVPIVALSLLTYDVATDTEDVLLQAIIPAFIAAAIGILLISIRSIRAAKVRQGAGSRLPDRSRTLSCNRGAAEREVA